jgi:hypothetical protein
MALEFTAGKLGVRYINYSRRTGGAPVLQPETWGVLIHSTEGHEGGDLPILTGATTQNGKADGTKASVHFYIPQEQTKKIIAFGGHKPGDCWALWHAGKSSWQGVDGLNRYLIGIELEHVAGEAYTDAQMDNLYALLGYLADLYRGQPYWRGWLLRHREVAPERKNDPTRPFDEKEWPTLKAWWDGRYKGGSELNDQERKMLEDIHAKSRQDRVTNVAHSNDTRALLAQLRDDPAEADRLLADAALAGLKVKQAEGLALTKEEEARLEAAPK